MRNTFVQTLIEEANKNEKIFLLTGDLGYGVLEPFAEKFPDRFLNMGVAEQNMAGVASGLAKEGFTVFFYSIGNFPTLRCMEQIRYDICYHQMDVKIIAVGAGYAYGPLGVSHHTTEDLGMLRVIPELMVTSPADPTEVEAITRWMCNNKMPSYMRINKSGERRMYESSLNFSGNEVLSILRGTNVAVLSTGALLESAYDFIKENKKNWSLYSCPFLKEISPSALIEIFNNHKVILTIEEHQLSGGFGSFILESLNELEVASRLSSRPTVHRIGIPNRFISQAGTQEHLRSLSGLNLEKYIYLD